MADTGKAKRTLRDAEMRQILYEWLYAQTEEALAGRPCPSLGDNWVEEELRRIFLGWIIEDDGSLGEVTWSAVIGLVGFILGAVGAWFMMR